MLWDLFQDHHLLTTTRRLKGLRQKLADQAQINTVQGRRIEALETENEQLRDYVGALARSLMAKGVVSEEEISRLLHPTDTFEGLPR